MLKQCIFRVKNTEKLYIIYRYIYNITVNVGKILTIEIIAKFLQILKKQ